MSVFSGGSFTLEAPGACKIRRGCKVLQVPRELYLFDQGGILIKILRSDEGSKLRDQFEQGEP